MRLPPISRTAVRRAGFVLLLLGLLSACGVATVHDITATPELVILTATDPSRSVTLGYDGPAGSTVTVHATVSDDSISVSPASVVIPAGGSATVIVSTDPDELMDRAALTVLFHGRRVADETVRVSLEPGCFIDPDASLQGSRPSWSAARLGLGAPVLDHVPGELLVSYHAFATALSTHGGDAVATRTRLALDVAATAGVDVHRLGRAGEHDLVRVTDDLDAAAARLRADGRVAHVSRNYVAHRLALPNDQYYPAQWFLWGFGAEQAWQIEDATGPGQDVVIAIIDDGLAIDHVNLAAKTLPGYDIYCGDADVRAFSHHGTHVAGIAAAGTHPEGVVVGVAIGERARILPVKVFPDDEFQAGTLDSVIRGMRWAAGLDTAGAPTNPTPAHIINLSLGFAPNISPDAIGILETTAATVDARGILMVAAAGNDSRSTGVAYPARLPTVVAVGSVDWDFRRSVFSDHGAGLALMAPGGIARNVVPQAVALCNVAGDHTIVSAGIEGPGAARCDTGTSMASPFVAGTAALLIAHDPDRYRNDPAALLETLIATAYWPPHANEAEYGAGIVCLDAALGAPEPCSR